MSEHETWKPSHIQIDFVRELHFLHSCEPDVEYLQMPVGMATSFALDSSKVANTAIETMMQFGAPHHEES